MDNIIAKLEKMVKFIDQDIIQICISCLNQELMQLNLKQEKFLKQWNADVKGIKSSCRRQKGKHFIGW